MNSLYPKRNTAKVSGIRAFRGTTHIRIRRNLGFSLIEVLVSLGILAVGLLAVMSMQTATLRANINNQNLLMGQQVAEVAIEWVRTLSARELSSAADMFPVVGKSSLSQIVSSDSDFDQFTGSGFDPTDYPSGFSANFFRLIGHRVRYVQDPTRAHVDRLFVVRVGVDTGYSTAVNRCLATVYWMEDGELVSFDVVFFVERRV